MTLLSELLMIFGAALFFSLFFSSLSICFLFRSFFFFSTEQFLQKCAAVEASSAPAVNYSFHLWRGSVLAALKRIRHLITGVGPRSVWLCQSGDPPSPNYRRNCSGISSLLERQEALTLELGSQKWVPCGERRYPTTAENLRWRLDAWSPPPCPQPARTTTVQVLDLC